MVIMKAERYLYNYVICRQFWTTIISEISFVLSFIIYIGRHLFSCKRFINKSEVHFISLEIKLRLRWCSERQAVRGKRAPPARRRACSENARGVTIVSLRIVTKFDDRNHPPSTRAGSSRSDSRRGVGAVQCVPSARLCNSKTYLCINLKIASIISVSMTS